MLCIGIFPSNYALSRTNFLPHLCISKVSWSCEEPGGDLFLIYFITGYQLVGVGWEAGGGINVSTIDMPGNVTQNKQCFHFDQTETIQQSHLSILCLFSTNYH